MLQVVIIQTADSDDLEKAVNTKIKELIQENKQIDEVQYVSPVYHHSAQVMFFTAMIKYSPAHPFGN